MPKFETFSRSIVPLSRKPRITIQKRGTITINAAAFAALHDPEAVELLYDPDARILGLRTVPADRPHAAFVRPSARGGKGPWVISAMAFLHHYEIDTSVARRWPAALDADALCACLGEPGQVVSKSVPRPQTTSRSPALRPSATDDPSKTSVPDPATIGGRRRPRPHPGSG